VSGRGVEWRHAAAAAGVLLAASVLIPSAGKSQTVGTARAAGSEPATEDRPAVAEGAGRGGAWFPDRSVFWDLLAPPRENGLYASLIGFEQQVGPFAGRRTLAAEVQLGYLLVARRFQSEARSRPGMDLGVEFAITPRFNLDEPQKDLINTDFQLGIPFSLKYGPFQGRLGYLHESSHLGDETILRYSLGLLEQSTRDAFELTLAYQILRVARVYVGGGWNWNHSDSNESLIGSAGLEVDPGRVDPGAVIWPYAAADFVITDLTDRVAGSLVGGAGWRVAERVIRLELRGHFGPSPMGQFRDVDEEYIGVALRFEPFPPP
jgi:hypothetical protein